MIFYNCSVSAAGFFLRTLTLGFPLLTVLVFFEICTYHLNFSGTVGNLAVCSICNWPLTRFFFNLQVTERGKVTPS